MEMAHKHSYKLYIKYKYWLQVINYKGSDNVKLRLYVENLIMKAYHLLECDAMLSSRSPLIYQRSVLRPSSGLKSKPRKIQTSSKSACLIYCSALKLEAVSWFSYLIWLHFTLSILLSCLLFGISMYIILTCSISYMYCGLIKLNYWRTSVNFHWSTLCHPRR
jgi:hypothetical protein